MSPEGFSRRSHCPGRLWGQKHEGEVVGRLTRAGSGSSRTVFVFGDLFDLTNQSLRLCVCRRELVRFPSPDLHVWLELCIIRILIMQKNKVGKYR